MHVRLTYTDKNRHWGYSGDGNFTSLVRFLDRPCYGTDTGGNHYLGLVAKHLVHAALVSLRFRHWDRHIVLAHFPPFEQGDRRFDRLRSNERHDR